jgi:hypothetical protein
MKQLCTVSAQKKFPSLIIFCEKTKLSKNELDLLNGVLGFWGAIRKVFTGMFFVQLRIAVLGQAILAHALQLIIVVLLAFLVFPLFRQHQY